jgi:hypothetical protein
MMEQDRAFDVEMLVERDTGLRVADELLELLSKSLRSSIGRRRASTNA